jgi:hypothetical protein
MTTADLRAVAPELGGDLIIRTKPAQGEAFGDSTGWVEQASESST